MRCFFLRAFQHGEAFAVLKANLKREDVWDIKDGFGDVRKKALSTLSQNGRSLVNAPY